MLEAAIGAHAPQVARPAHDHSRIGRAPSESLRAELRSPPIPLGEEGVGGGDLAHLAGRRGATLLVEDGHLHAWHGVPHRHRLGIERRVLVDEEADQRAGLREGEPVHEDALVREDALVALDVARGHRVAGKSSDAEHRESLRSGEAGHELAKQRGTRPVGRDLLVDQPADHPRHALGAHVERAQGRPVQEGEQDVHDRLARADARRLTRSCGHMWIVLVQLATHESMWRCVIGTPFGRPVDPEVYTSPAISSGEMAPPSA